ncbi:hypothetical protein [Puniceibacterium sediminis]|uniref:Uncharacterized protein n=1 Tax=Puniceibacterium sediminis TaxID=1608407 RepID=A0A238WPF0_9RHOB|nr:hypothetical protein [Puniceibacterium sediminis]SNR48347.1 hypothetical protein SAMN06265370_106213 [Puniceibacterium sediminis]
MSRKFIITVLAAAVALTGLTAAPARAETNEALLRALGIGTTLLIVGAAIKNAKDHDDDKKKKKKARQVEPEPRHEYGYVDRDFYNDRNRYENRGRFGKHGRQDFGRGRAPLPSSCLISPRGGAQVFEARCLQQRYDQSRSLPDYCRTTARTRQGNVSVYEPSCLRRSGYEIARR